jgi:hypothetical protein
VAKMDTALISSLTALAAVVFAPIVSIYVAKRQIRASVVSVNRQAWINRLRDELVFSFVKYAWYRPHMQRTPSLCQRQSSAMRA